MNRRNFFKVVTGFVAGIFAGSTAKSKLVCRPKSGPPGPTDIHCTDDSKEKLVCVTPNAKRYIKWVRKEYPQFS